MATLLEQSRELKNQRARLVAESRIVLEAAEARGEILNAEEQAKYDKIHADVSALTQRSDLLERQFEAENKMDLVQPNESRAGNPGDEARDTGPKEYRTRSEARPGVPAIERQYDLNDPHAELRGRAFRSYLAAGEKNGLSPEMRELQNTDDTKGGYTTPPQQFVADLIQRIDDLVWIRGLATVMQLTSGDSMGRPSLDADPADADWTSELGTGSEDDTMRFGKRELNPSPLAKRIKVSRTLLRRSALNVESVVQARFAYKFGVTQEKSFLTGNGADQPLGVFTASANGISTGRDVSAGNTDTAFTADGLIAAKYAVKGAYWPRSRWLFHRDAVKNLAQLKDGEGRYLWQGSVVGGSPDTLLGLPMLVSEYAPNTFTTGQYVGIIGDFSQYWIAEALNMNVQRLDELYAETNQVGYIARMELDGMPVLEEAFARVKLT